MILIILIVCSIIWIYQTPQTEKFIDLPVGDKLINADIHGTDILMLTQPMYQSEVPVIYEFKNEKGFKIIIKEHWR